MDKYTRIREFEGEYQVFLTVDHQSFCVTPVPYKEQANAEWMRCQLALALHKLVKKETQNA